MSKTIKVIRKLQSLIAKIKAHAIKVETRKLEVAAERIDIADELCKKRQKVALDIALQLQQRARVKHVEDLDKANKAKKEAGDKVTALANL